MANFAEHQPTGHDSWSRTCGEKLFSSPRRWFSEESEVVEEDIFQKDGDTHYFPHARFRFLLVKKAFHIIPTFFLRGHPIPMSTMSLRSVDEDTDKTLEDKKQNATMRGGILTSLSDVEKL